MRRRSAFLAVLAVGVLVAAVVGGCSDKPRPIEEAQPFTTPGAETPKEWVTQSAPAASEPAALAVVEAAVKAHAGGNPDRLQKLKFVKVTRVGQGNAGGAVHVPQKWLVHAAWPNRFRFEIEMPGPQVGIIGRIGDKGWSGRPGLPRQDNTPELGRNFEIDSSAEWLWMLFPLTEPGTVVATAPDAVVNGKPAAGVRVWAQGITEAVLYFDKETRQLVRMTFDGRENNARVVKEVTISGSKDYGGLVLAEKMVLRANGNLLAEWTMTQLEPLPTIDPKLFEGP